MADKTDSNEETFAEGMFTLGPRALLPGSSSGDIPGLVMVPTNEILSPVSLYPATGAAWCHTSGVRFNLKDEHVLGALPDVTMFDGDAESNTFRLEQYLGQFTPSMARKIFEQCPQLTS